MGFLAWKVATASSKHDLGPGFEAFGQNEGSYNRGTGVPPNHPFIDGFSILNIQVGPLSAPEIVDLLAPALLVLLSLRLLTPLATRCTGLGDRTRLQAVRATEAAAGNST